MPDLVDRVRDDIDERLHELRPVVDEYETLRRARELMAGAVEPERRPVRGGRSTSASRRQRPVARGERTSQILALLRERPEITPRELAQQLDTTRQNISVTLGHLKKQRVISREGAAWVVPGEPE